MRLSVILPVMVLCLCGGLLTIARSGTAPDEPVARPRTGMELLRQYDCRRAETKVVLVRGKEDNFSPEGSEPLFLRPGLDTVRTASLVRGGSYDQSQPDRGVMDSFRTPARIAKGLFVVSVKPVGSNQTDTIAMGRLESTSGRLLFSKGLVRLGEGDEWGVDGSLRFAELAHIPLNRPGPDDPSRTLLDEFGDLAEPDWLDVWINDDTSVDFMGLAVCVKPPGGKGLALSVRPAATEYAPDIIAFSCNVGDNDTPICDAIFGDTPCGAALPVACMRPGQIPAPPTPHWDRWNWTGGDIALTRPVAAARFSSIRDVDRYCVQSLGPDWRTATMHDSGRAGGIAGRGKAPSGPTRAWVDIVDQPYGTCWTR